MVAAVNTARVAQLRNIAGCAAVFASLTFLPAHEAHAQDDWTYTVKPYGWYVWLDGDTGAEGSAPVESDSDLFDMLDGFFLITGEARKEKLSLLAEFNWVDMSDDVRLRNRSTDWALEGYMVALGAGYAVYEHDDARVEVIAGLRYWDIDVETTVLGRKASADTTITDPFIGARVSSPISDRLSVHGMASYGTGGDSDQQFDIAAEVRWKWTERADVAVGARYLRLDFEKDAALVDASLYGPYVGIAFNF